MATYINGVDRTMAVAKGSVVITNTLNSAIDTMQLEINPNSIIVEGGEEIIMTDDSLSVPGPAPMLAGAGGITIGDKAHLSFTDLKFTIEFSLKLNSTVNQGILGKRGNPWEYSIHTNALGNFSFVAWTSAGSIIFSHTNIPADLQRHHYAWVVDVSTSYLFIDGVLASIANKSGASSMGNTNRPFIIGQGGSSGSTLYLDGTISEVRVWNVPRNVAEINRDKDRELQGWEPGLVGYWPLNEGGGTVAHDKSPYQAHSTSISGVTWQEAAMPLRGRRIFGGHMTNPEEVGDKTQLGYSVQCQDYTPQLNRLLVNANYVSVRNATGAYDDPAESPYVWTLGKIVRDLMTQFGPDDFTTVHVVDENDPNTIIDSASFSYLYLTDCFDELKKITGYDWYVDYYKNLYFFKAEGNAAPEALTDNSYNFKELRFTIDRSQLRNRVYVKGGTELEGPDSVDPQPTQVLFGQAAGADASQAQAVFGLAHEPFELENPADFTVTKAGSNYKIPALSEFKILVLRVYHGGAQDGLMVPPSSGNSNPVVTGVQNIHSFFDVQNQPTPYDALVQIDRIPWIKLRNPLPSDQRLEVYYMYKVPILVSADNQLSINAVKAIEGGSGVYEYIVDEPDIITFDAARERARAELKRYADPIVSGRFITHKPGFQAGQFVTIDVTRSNGKRMQGSFLISEVVRQSDGVGWTYDVTFSMMLYDIEEFFRQVIKKINRVDVSKNDILDILFSLPEVVRVYENVELGFEPPQDAKWAADGFEATIARSGNLQAVYDNAKVKSNLTIDPGTGGIKLSAGQSQGELQTQWFDKGIDARVIVDFTSTATLPEGSNVRYYFRTSTASDGSNPTRWKTYEEVKTSLDRYVQVKVVFQSGSGTAIPIMLGFMLKYMVLATPRAQYGHVRWKP